VVWLVLGCSSDPGGIQLPGHWHLARPLPEPRFEASAATVGGRIYYLGGIDLATGDRDTDRVDIYDPATDSWAPGPALPADGGKNHLATAVVGDTLYVLGGFNVDAVGGLHGNARTWALDAAGWHSRADQPIARGGATAELIGERIFVAGGGPNELQSVTDLWAYDPRTDSWSTQAAMPTARQHVASCLFQDLMLVAGGWVGTDKQVLGAAELYDPTADQWTTLPDLPTARGGLAAATVGGICYVIGGERWHDALPDTFRANEGWDGHSWRQFAPMPTARHGLGLAQLAGSLFAIGGGPSRGNSYTTVVEVFTP
jgi:N-acetylneuraminic acid mutarotase